MWVARARPLTSRRKKKKKVLRPKKKEGAAKDKKKNREEALERGKKMRRGSAKRRGKSTTPHGGSAGGVKVPSKKNKHRGKKSLIESEHAKWSYRKVSKKEPCISSERWSRKRWNVTRRKEGGTRRKSVSIKKKKDY